MSEDVKGDLINITTDTHTYTRFYPHTLNISGAGDTMQQKKTKKKNPQLPLNQILIFNFYVVAHSDTMPVVT